MEPQIIFMYISCIVIGLVAFIIPKKIKRQEMYATSLFAILLGLIIDIVAERFKIYVLDKPGIQINALIGQILLYSATNIILLNLFPFNKSVKQKFLYILLFTFVTVAFELLSYKFGFIKYYQWNIWYSIIAYPFLICLVILHYRFFQKLLKKDQV
ncbi:CBO0543 family protein [Bacillus kwashiorkori]|uniref:CBO0543 family protein n=1 Tax=Bacillus kwashiorkori TaxID=1522318 RepID=UPI0007837776|nr:CBO0543 family protein [Bacillus kwashiorkori]